jgi:hypothetical protein
MNFEPSIIGRVTRCSTRGFVGAARAPEPEIPFFGAFCKAEAQQGISSVVGLIYDISIEDDELTRQMAAADRPPDEELADQRFVRQVPIEYAALAVGYWTEDKFHYRLPPQPPLALAPILALSSSEILAFTERLDFIPTILSAENLPSDDLLAASIHAAAMVRDASERRSFLIDAGRYCAHILVNDLTRLENLIRRFTVEK